MTTPITDEIREVVYEIARRLRETERAPINTIARIVRRLGREATLGWVEQAETIEANGGMTLPDGKRRTLGGVFFKLVKDSIPKEDRYRIFPLQQRHPPGVSRTQ